MRNKHTKRRRLLGPAIALFIALALIVTGVILYAYEKNTAVQTAADTEGHVSDRATGKPDSEATGQLEADTTGAGPVPTVVGKDEQPGADITPVNTQTEEEEQGNVYAYVDSRSDSSIGGRGPGDTSNVNVNDVTRYYTPDQLGRGLLYELKQYAADFAQAQYNYKIDAVFLAAVAAEESGYGRYTQYKNNIFGYGNYYFESVPQCIDFVASKLRNDYLNETGIFYNGYSVSDVNRCYNGRDTWTENVTTIMGEIVARIEQ